MHKKNRKPPCRRIVLRLPDLDRAKSAVLTSLSSPRSRRNYKFAMGQLSAQDSLHPRENAGYSTGNLNSARHPVRPSVRFDSCTEPLCAWAICCARTRPIPVPSGLVV